jgi:hypothetical protein
MYRRSVAASTGRSLVFLGLLVIKTLMEESVRRVDPAYKR